MQIFYGLVNKDPDSAYGVEFPDIPGCFSAADDEGALLANACDALICHLEGEEVPESSDIESIRVKHAAELKDGAFLLAVPYIVPAAKTVRANISLDAGMLNAIDEAAAQRNMTRSVFIAHSSRLEIEGQSLQLATPGEEWRDPEGNAWIIHHNEKGIGQIRISRAAGNTDRQSVKLVSDALEGWERVSD